MLICRVNDKIFVGFSVMHLAQHCAVSRVETVRIHHKYKCEMERNCCNRIVSVTTKTRLLEL